MLGRCGGKRKRMENTRRSRQPISCVCGSQRGYTFYSFARLNDEVNRLQNIYVNNSLFGMKLGITLKHIHYTFTILYTFLKINGKENTNDKKLISDELFLF